MFEPFMNQLKALFLTSAEESRDNQSLALLSINTRTAAASVRAARLLWPAPRQNSSRTASGCGKSMHPSKILRTGLATPS